jgi:hypothetical protein
MGVDGSAAQEPAGLATALSTTKVAVVTRVPPEVRSTAAVTVC